jgi:hypothetical protein
MKEFDETNRGAIWKNDKKETEKHPDWKGSINVEGVDYWLSGWSRKQGDNPKSPSVRFSVQRKDDVQRHGMAQARESAGMRQTVNNIAPEPFIDDSIPF